MKWLYLFIHVFTISFPLIRSFESKVHYASKWKALFPAIAITATFFLIWDVIFTAKGVWGFNHDYHLDLLIGGLPLEEWMFFVTVPFSSIFIYECLYYFYPNLKTTAGLRVTGQLGGITITVLGILFSHQSYTFWCFIFTGPYLLVLSTVNPSWFGKFILAYFIHLVPFMLVNGVLTGSFIDEPIVWYNNNENFGVRVFTIPIEDSIYALLLLMMNITFFEWFKFSFNRQTFATS